MKALPYIIAIIRSNADQRGIFIEIGGHKNKISHKSGKVFVRFPGNNRLYEYRDTITRIGLKLELITASEIDALLIEHDKYVKCHCGVVHPLCTGFRNPNWCGNC